jgi:two-component system NarL family sensor kinase
VVEKQLDPDHPACAALQRLRTQAEAAYQGVRRASHALRPLILHDLGLGKALQRVVAQFEETTGIVVRFQADDLGALPDDVELALLRVAQESLENVRKHSHATEAEILLRRADGHVRLSIADRGQGMPERGERGIGLAIMHERVEAVGGMLQVASSLGAGVTVEAAVPIRSDEG